MLCPVLTMCWLVARTKNTATGSVTEKGKKVTVCLMGARTQPAPAWTPGGLIVQPKMLITWENRFNYSCPQTGGWGNKESITL